ncbi:MAG: hypothetical protein F6K28_57005, partial [Microcoleus sp. SIO2G3]|nr:hypothetical protein [Microcoleus sp. SIO2G3]
MLKLLQAIAAFCDGFFTGLKIPPQRITAYLESDSPQPQLPSAQRQPLTPIELEIIAQAETVQMSRSQPVEFIDTNY